MHASMLAYRQALRTGAGVGEAGELCCDKRRDYQNLILYEHRTNSPCMCGVQCREMQCTEGGHGLCARLRSPRRHIPHLTKHTAAHPGNQSNARLGFVPLATGGRASTSHHIVTEVNSHPGSGISYETQPWAKQTEDHSLCIVRSASCHSVRPSQAQYCMCEECVTEETNAN